MSTLVEFIDNNKDTTIISFTGIGSDYGGIPPFEFKSLTQKYNMIYVTDISRSWFNNVDVKEIIKYIKKDQRVITLGNSMGAFNACCFTNIYDVDKCIMFATQYSIKADIVPFETRWRKLASKITNWKYPYLQFNQTTTYYIIQGNHPCETQHTDLIPNRPNINKFFVKKSKHKVAKKLKLQNKLHDLIINIIEDNSFTL